MFPPMSSSEFAKDFAARTDYGTSDYLQASGCIAGGVGSHSSKRKALLNPKVGPDCLYVCPLLPGIHVNVRGGLGPDFARIGVSL